MLMKKKERKGKERKKEIKNEYPTSAKKWYKFVALQNTTCALFYKMEKGAVAFLLGHLSVRNTLNTLFIGPFYFIVIFVCARAGYYNWLLLI